MNVGGRRKGVVPARALGFFLCFALSFGSGPCSAESEPQLQHRGRTMAEWQADLSDAKPQVRLRATVALESFGATAVPALVQALGDPHWQICDSAMHALIRIGPPAAAPLIQVLADPNSKIRGRSAYVLGRIRPAEPASVRALAQALSDANVLFRMTVAKSLEVLGADARDAVPALVRALHDDNQSVRTSSSRALMRIGPTDPAVIPGLIHGLSARFPDHYSLVVIGPPACSGLVQVLTTGSSNARGEAALILGRIRPVEPFVLAALLKALHDDPAPEVRGRAASSLGTIGSVDGSVIPALLQALQDPQPLVRQWAAGALGGIASRDRVRDPAMVRALIQALGDPDPDVRRGAAGALGSITPADQDTIHALVRALEGPHYSLAVRAAVEALGRIGPAARPALVEAGRRGSNAVKTRVPDALGIIDSLDITDVPSLVRALEGRSVPSEVRARAAEVLADLTPPPAAALPAFVRILRAKDDSPKQFAALALERLAPADRDAIEALVLNLKHDIPGVRGRAALALSKIGPPVEAIPELERVASEPVTQYMFPGLKLEVEQAVRAVRDGEAAKGRP